MKLIELDCYIDDPKNNIGAECHVVGWSENSVFILQSTDGKNHVLFEPKTRKVYFTDRELIHERKQLAELRGM